MKCLIEALLCQGCFFPLLFAVGCFFLLFFVVVMEVLAFARPQVVIWDAVIGSGAVSLYPLTLLFSGDDDITGITANIDHAVEVAVGIVK